MPKTIDGNVIVTRESLLRQTEEQENLLRECYNAFRQVESVCATPFSGYEQRCAREIASNLVARLEESGYGY